MDTVINMYEECIEYAGLGRFLFFRPGYDTKSQNNIGLSGEKGADNILCPALYVYIHNTWTKLSFFFSGNKKQLYYIHCVYPTKCMWKDRIRTSFLGVCIGNLTWLAHIINGFFPLFFSFNPEDFFSGSDGWMDRYGASAP